jgi:hypothetical protein
MVTSFMFNDGYKYGQIIRETPANFVILLNNGDTVYRKKKRGYKQRESFANIKKVRGILEKLSLHVRLFVRNIGRKQ